VALDCDGCSVSNLKRRPSFWGDVERRDGGGVGDFDGKQNLLGYAQRPEHKDELLGEGKYHKPSLERQSGIPSMSGYC
jgi:hypothetical protein